MENIQSYAPTNEKLALDQLWDSRNKIEQKLLVLENELGDRENIKSFFDVDPPISYDQRKGVFGLNYRKKNLKVFDDKLDTIQDINISSMPSFNRIYVGDGTAALPSMSFINDTDTGFYRVGANEIGIALNGALDFSFSANSFNVASGSVIDLNGNDLIIDADGDSYLHASADDVIDLILAGASGEFAININGAEDFNFTANAFNVLWGSQIYMADDSAIYFADANGRITFDDTTNRLRLFNASIALAGYSLLINMAEDAYINSSGGNDYIIQLVVPTEGAEFDIVLNGATDFSFTTNSFDVLSGSSITMADDTVIQCGSAQIEFDSTPAIDEINFLSCIVGINTQAPVSLLELSSATVPILTITGLHATAANPTISFRTDDPATEKASIYIDSAGAVAPSVDQLIINAPYGGGIALTAARPGCIIGDFATCTASAQFSIALGVNVDCTANFATGIGYDLTLSANNSIGIGRLISIAAASINSVAIGYGHILGTTSYEVAIGTSNTVDGQYGITIGVSCNVDAIYGIAMGLQAWSNASNAFSLGYRAYNTGANSVLIGHGGLLNNFNFSTTPAITFASGDPVTNVTISNTATNGDPVLHWAMGLTVVACLGADDDNSDLLKLGSTSITTNTTMIWDVINQRVGLAPSGTTIEAQLHIVKSNANATLYMDTYDDGTAVSTLAFRRSLSDTIGTRTETTTGKYLGDIVFYGVDSGGNFDVGADIYAIQNGAAGVKVPTDLIMYTCSATAVNTNLLVLSTGGNIGLGTATFDATANKVLTIANGTAPAAAVADGIEIYSSDTGDATATLSLYLEQAVEVIGTFTASHKIKVRINGTLYWLSLDAV